ncbi:MAG: DUF5698 domain-containing protein [Clostridiales bacterium]|jgi:uncharacterized protein YebE (UPF0316 family)|nr:DUF5698 domain-containing protein [Clostridiales bacterium]
MAALLEKLMELSRTANIWIYLIIFFGKMAEVATSTLRIVLINRGIRVTGSLIAVVEITLWLVITGTVLSSFHTDPLKMLVYAVAFGLGNFIGSWLDEQLAFGLSSLQVVVPDMVTANGLCEQMRKNGFGISTLEVRGKDEQQHYMLLMMVRRKRLKEGLALINGMCDNAVITVSDVKSQKGGYMRNAAKRRIHNPLK